MNLKDFKRYELFLCLAILLLSCDKSAPKIPEEPPEDPKVTTELAYGFPEHKQKINGYLYAAHSKGPEQNTYTFLYAAFGDPRRNLMSSYNHRTNQPILNTGVTAAGNVTVGAVTYNSRALDQDPSAIYRSVSTTSTVDNSAPHWSTMGNGSFKPLDIRLSREFPAVNVPASFSWSKSQDFRIDLSEMASNYDSAGVFLYFTNHLAFSHIKK